MADEVVADDPALAQEPVAAAAQGGAAPADLAPDATADGGADAEVGLALPADPDTLDALWERYPSLREQAEQSQTEKLRERELAGADRERKRLQREAGKAVQTRQNVSRFLAEIGVDVEDTARLDYFYELAQANSALEIATSLPEAALRNYTVPVEAREAALEARERGDWDGYVTGIVNGAVTAEVAKLRAEDEKKISAEVNRRLAGEIKARQIEQAPVREGAPARPAGGQSGGAPVNPYALDTKEYGALSVPERRAMVDAWERWKVSQGALAG